jgi:predicted enzyme related to lactoylglutathione lyase
MVYISVADCDERTRRAKELGGSITNRHPATFALFQPKS